MGEVRDGAPFTSAWEFAVPLITFALSLLTLLSSLVLEIPTSCASR